MANNNIMEKYSKIEIEESIRKVDEFVERFRSHKCDWTEVLNPIKKQLETMNFTEVINILQDEYGNKYANNIIYKPT
jgi:hypothetical protein